jgi:hypothetical protein
MVTSFKVCSLLDHEENIHQKWHIKNTNYLHILFVFIDVLIIEKDTGFEKVYR